jgi:Putative amidoligase enzyme
MCQARSEGGRRCPVHRYESIAALKIAQSASGLTSDQVKDVFKELRREGRHTAETERQYYDSYLDSLQLRTTNLSNAESVSAKIDEARSEESMPDGATFYALRRVQERALERGRALQGHLSQVAVYSGNTPARVQATYEREYAGVDRSRGAEVPEEFTQTSVRQARRAGLPYDRSTVVALARLDGALESDRGPRRVDLEPLQFAPGSAIGYDPEGGRLEVSLHGGEDGDMLVYRNVPQELADRLSTSTNASLVETLSSEVIGVSDFAYASREEAEQDAHTIRCGACGQFRAASHACPAAELVHELQSINASVDTTEEVLTDAFPRDEVEEVSTSEDSVVPASVTDVRVVEVASVEGEDALFPEEYGTDANHQRNPRPFDGESFTEREIPFARLPRSASPRTINAKSAVEDNLNYTEQEIFNNLSEEDQNIVAAAGNSNASTNFIIAPKYEINAENNTLVGVTDDHGERVYTIVGSYDSHRESVDLGDASHGRLIIRTPLKSHLDNNPYLEDEERWSNERGRRWAPWEIRSDSRSQYRDRVLYGVDANHVELQKSANMVRRVNPDPGNSDNDRIIYARSSDLKRTLNSGKSALSKVEWSGQRSGITVDSQGYTMPEGQFRVRGESIVKKNANGTIESVTDSRTLRCNCDDYADNYHCAHVDYVRRHMPTVAQQILPDPNATPRTRAVFEFDNPTGLLTSGLARRSYVSAVPATEERPAYISLGETPDEFSRSATAATLTLPSELRAAAQADGRSLIATAILSNRESSVQAPPPSVVRQALNRGGDVSVPVRLDFATNSWDIAHGTMDNGTVEGTVMLRKNSDGEITVVERSLKCNCAEYQENYDCVHVRELVARASGLANNDNVRAGYQTEVRRSVINRSYVYAEDIYVVAENMRVARAQGISYEEARDTREQRLREEQERYEEEERQREIERAEEARIRREQWEERNRGLVDGMKNRRALIAEQWQNADPSYADNPQQFFQDYEDALARKAAGEEVLTYATENVTDGICADEPGARAFGIELEFDIGSGHDRYEALEKIGQELHEAGLTNTSEQVAYHSAGDNGYSTWSFEEDCTVDAELVSPLMKDTPEHWAQLKTAVDIITRNGGVATARTGSHVHVSTASYGASTAKHAELLRAVNANEDTLYRLASDPSRGSHRGTQWCRPNVAYDTDYVSGEEQDTSGYDILGYSHSGHGVGVNFEGSGQQDIIKSNVEFRMWDGTLNPAVIQQQVKISAAMTEYADQHVSREGGSRKKEGQTHHKVGDTRRKESDILSEKSAAKHDADTFQATNSHVASFIDTMFRRKEDRASVAALFAVTNWQNN